MSSQPRDRLRLGARRRRPQGQGRQGVKDSFYKNTLWEKTTTRQEGLGTGTVKDSFYDNPLWENRDASNCHRRSRQPAHREAKTTTRQEGLFL